MCHLAFEFDRINLSIFQPPFRRRSYAGALPNEHHLTVSVTRLAFSRPATKRQDKLIEWTRKTIDQ